MKPPPFAYQRAFSAADAVARLAEAGDEAKLLAGGQSLVPMLAFRLVRPTVLIDLKPVEELSYLRVDDDGALWVGALTPHRGLESIEPRLIARGHRLLPEAARWVGHAPIRARGTFAGSLAHADPSAEWCLMCVLLDADLTVLGPAGSRVVPAREFFRGYLTTDLAADEMIVEARLPATGPAVALEEVARRHGDFALASAAVALDVDGAGICQGARIALGGVAEVPMRAGVAEAGLTGHPLDQEAIREAAALATRDLEPLPNAGVSGDYRRRLTRVLVERALSTARERARKDGGDG
ncbi:MAG: FAD binding domain-containing protein [Actinobacteria bacterium]|nr:FAD binding domain-containing protein [Actinomycetota bacterium]